MQFNNLTFNGFDITKIMHWVYKMNIYNYLNHNYYRYYYNIVNRDAHLME